MKLKTILIISLLCFLPTLVGLGLWNQLPSELPTHFDSSGVADDYSSKAFVVFGLPFFMALLNLFIHFIRKADPKHVNHNPSFLALIHGLFPVLSILCVAISILSGLNITFPVNLVIYIFVGLLISGIGFYLPKCEQNYVIGIKLPWTLNSVENWNYTHRLAGPIWVAGGVLLMVSGFFNSLFLCVIILVVMIGIPTFLSYQYYKKVEVHSDEDS